MKLNEKKCELCDDMASCKGLCVNHYYQKLYREKRINFKDRRAKYNKEIIYFDYNMNRIAPPFLQFNGTSFSPLKDYNLNN